MCKISCALFLCVSIKTCLLACELFLKERTEAEVRRRNLNPPNQCLISVSIQQTEKKTNTPCTKYYCTAIILNL